LSRPVRKHASSVSQGYVAPANIPLQTLRKNEKLHEQLNFEETEGLLYGPGIDD